MLEEVVHLLAPMGRRMPMHVVVVHVGVADAQAVDCFAILVTEGAIPQSDLDVVFILTPCRRRRRTLLQLCAGSAAKPAGYRGFEPSVWNKSWRHTHGPDT